MEKFKLIFMLCVIAIGLDACKKQAANNTSYKAEITPVAIETKGFDFMEKMQGQWVGYNKVLGWEWDWFAFDFRAISENHTFAIYEGGEVGNLLISFFVSNFNNTKTIMARNGGLLNGIYRSSYFVLDSVLYENNLSYYRFVDAYGGKNTMFMELVFEQDSLNFNVYTSRLGENQLPTRHMTFKANKEICDLALAAANNFNYPQKTVSFDFSGGFNEAYLYVPEGHDGPKSATFLSQGNGSLTNLANQSGDPFTINDYPSVGYLNLSIMKNSLIQNKEILVYLSKNPLTDNDGYLLGEDAFDSVLLFSSLGTTSSNFVYTYLHPGDYYITIVADGNEDQVPNIGDISHVSKFVSINPKGNHQITISNINVQN